MSKLIIKQIYKRRHLENQGDSMPHELNETATVVKEN